MNHSEQPRQFPYRFFVVTFLWSWALCLPLVLMGREFPPKLIIPTLVLAAFGPALGAAYSLKTLHGKGAVRRYFLGVLDLRFGWKVWVIPIIASGGSTGIAWLLPELWGAPPLNISLQSAWEIPSYFLIMMFIGGGQEELGWRGYILDPIEERLGPWLGNVVLGIIWAVWHLPLFLLPGTGQAYTPYLAFLLFTIGLSWFFSWVRQASRKRITSGIYAHALVNVFGTIFPTVVTAAGTLQTRYWIWASLAFIIGLAANLQRSKRITAG